jgi:hypothetical protein
MPQFSELPDQELIRLIDVDPKAVLDALHERYHRLIWVVIFRKLGTWRNRVSRACEIASDFWLRLTQNPKLLKSHDTAQPSLKGFFTFLARQRVLISQREEQRKAELLAQFIGGVIGGFFPPSQGFAGAVNGAIFGGLFGYVMGAFSPFPWGAPVGGIGGAIAGGIAGYNAGNAAPDFWSAVTDSSLVGSEAGFITGFIVGGWGLFL